MAQNSVMPNYNLVIHHAPGHQQVSDFLTVRNMMFGRAPDIAVHIVSRGAAVPPDFWRGIAQLPTLVFSPAHESLDDCVRGTKLIGGRLSKLKEIELLTAAGLPVPMTKAVTPGIVLDEARWGPFVVLKPIHGTFGRGISLARSRDVRWVDPQSWPQGDPRHGFHLLAQQYVHTGNCVRSYRTMTVLGRAIYCIVSTALAAQPPLDPAGDGPVDRPIAANGVPRKVELTRDAEVIALAEAVHASLPQLPNLGVDIVREERTGRLFVLEVNSSGQTWHLSSDFGLMQQRQYGLDYYSHSHALKIIADALIEATRRLAA